MDAYITASRTYYISAEDDASARHSTVKFFARRPEAAVDAAHRHQTNEPVAIVSVDTSHAPYTLHYELAPPEGTALASLFDRAALGAAQRHLHSRAA